MSHSLRPPFSEKDHYQGDIHATLELVEYGDYQCPYCGRAYPIIKQVQSKLGKDLRFVFRNFPLTDAHPQAYTAALAAEAAGRQDAYWKMHDLLYEKQESMSGERFFSELATTLRLDIAKFEADLLDPAIAKKVDEDFESGLRSGVNGTPGFFINGLRYDDDWNEKTLIARLQKTLARS
jgi:protein-disulfide isomerase